MNKTSQRGFTLIELVVVIVILGILAAFAVPRFMGMETEARIAAVRNLAGSLRSAAAMGHGVCMAQNCPNASTLVTMSGIAAPVTFVNQYPNNIGIQALLENANGFTTNAAGNTFTKTGAKVPAGCWVTYTQPAAANTTPTITFPGGLTLGSATDKAIDDQLRTAC